MRIDNEFCFIFPEYLDKTLTRKKGRRLSLEKAIEEPSIEELKQAAEKLGYKYNIRPDVAYPRSISKNNGVIMIQKIEPKLEIISKLSHIIRTIIRPSSDRDDDPPTPFIYTDPDSKPPPVLSNIGITKKKTPIEDVDNIDNDSTQEVKEEFSYRESMGNIKKRRS